MALLHDQETTILMNENAIITVYVIVDDMLKAFGHESDKRGSGPQVWGTIQNTHARVVLTSKFARLGVQRRFRQARPGLFLTIRQAAPASAANR